MDTYSLNKEEHRQSFDIRAHILHIFWNYGYALSQDVIPNTYMKKV